MHSLTNDCNSATVTASSGCSSNEPVCCSSPDRVCRDRAIGSPFNVHSSRWRNVIVRTTDNVSATACDVTVTGYSMTPGREKWQTKMTLSRAHTFSLQCFDTVGWATGRKGIRPVKKLDLEKLVCWWWWSDCSFARVTAPVVQLSPPLPSSFASLNTG